jgi:large subunit ribosomal protein L10
MDNPRSDKVAVVDEVRQRFDGANAAILTEYRGLKVKDLAGLRRSVRASGGDYKIYKNTLVRLAARGSGLVDLEELLVGPTAIAFVDGDAASVAKVLRDYARTNPLLVIKGGVLGDKVMDARATAALADLPPRDVLLARFAGGLAAPLQQLAGLLQALPRNLAYGLAALRDKRAEEAPSAAEAQPEAAASVTDDAGVTSSGAALAEDSGAGAPSVGDSAAGAPSGAASAGEPAGAPSGAPSVGDSAAGAPSGAASAGERAGAGASSGAPSPGGSAAGASSGAPSPEGSAAGPPLGAASAGDSAAGASSGAPSPEGSAAGASSGAPSPEDSAADTPPKAAPPEASPDSTPSAP